MTASTMSNQSSSSTNITTLSSTPSTIPPSVSSKTNIQSPSPIHKFIIRPALPSDAPYIAQLGSSVFATSFGHSLPPDDLAAYLQNAYSISSVLSTLEDPKMTTLVACPVPPTSLVSSQSQDSIQRAPASQDEQIYGFALVSRAAPINEPSIINHPTLYPKPIELQRIYVSPTSQGLGIGASLIFAADNLARKEGFETIWLGVWEENLKAQKVYSKAGYVRCGEHSFKMGETVQQDWIMWKSL